MAARGMLVGMTSLKNTLLMLGLAAWVAHAENWPQFRGPDGQGHSKESSVPTTWSATAYSDESGHLFRFVSDTDPTISDSCRSEATLGREQ
jgi:hypothetical protein